MRKPEQKLWDRMREVKPRGFWLQRIENVVGEGIPDVLSVRRGGLIRWVELKAPNCPARARTAWLGAEGLRVSQKNWHTRAARMKVKSYILARDDNMTLALIDGKWADEVNDWDLETVLGFSVAGSWEEIFDVLGK